MNYFEDRCRAMIDAVPAMAWSSLPDGSVEFLNRRWLDYTGAPLTDILLSLCDTIDAQSPEIISTAMLMDPDGKRLWPVAGHRIPKGRWLIQGNKWCAVASNKGREDGFHGPDPR
jgi:PAS domain-containing protein